jgi:hypothetical protein
MAIGLPLASSSEIAVISSSGLSPQPDTDQKNRRLEVLMSQNNFQLDKNRPCPFLNA